MKKLLFIVVAAAVAYGYMQKHGDALPSLPFLDHGAATELQAAYRDHRSDLQVRGSGTAIRLLPDDVDGSRHQRFILKTSTGQTLLIAHNIDLAPRINDLRTGDTVEFYGEYEWNAKGGVIHWTHRDPGNRHVDGWLKHHGRTYQ